jgi:hypothetical protein
MEHWLEYGYYIQSEECAISTRTNTAPVCVYGINGIMNKHSSNTSLLSDKSINQSINQGHRRRSETT